MFSKISTTMFRPDVPMLIWDGDCPFCHYWVVQLKKISNTGIQYLPYQEVHETIRDIPTSAFREAVRLIDTEGRVYNGPETAYWVLSRKRNWQGFMRYYRESDVFRYVSDALYSFASHHRSLMLKLTYVLLGSDPHNTKPYWLFYLVAFLTIVFIFLH